MEKKSKAICKENKPRTDLLAINHYKFIDRDKIEYFKSSFNSIDKSNLITLYNSGVLIPIYNKAIVNLADICVLWDTIPLKISTLLLSDMIGSMNIYDYLSDTRSKTWLKDYVDYLNQFEIVVIRKPKKKYSNNIFMIKGKIEKICDNEVHIRRFSDNKLSKLQLSEYQQYYVLFSKNHLELFLQREKNRIGIEIDKSVNYKQSCIDNYKRLIQSAERTIDKYYENYLVDTGKLDYLFENIF